jgi:hypothetical protein
MVWGPASFTGVDAASTLSPSWPGSGSMKMLNPWVLGSLTGVQASLSRPSPTPSVMPVGGAGPMSSTLSPICTLLSSLPPRSEMMNWSDSGMAPDCEATWHAASVPPPEGYASPMPAA